MSASNAASGFTEGTTSCMDCIRGATGGANTAITSVWCSGAWNYSYATLPMTQFYPKQIDGATGYVFSKLGGANTTAAAEGDLGGCCYDITTISAFVNVVSANAGTGT